MKLVKTLTVNIPMTIDEINKKYGVDIVDEKDLAEWFEEYWLETELRTEFETLEYNFKIID